MQNLILISVIISLFCVGLRIISSEGMIFYFLRKPYEWAIAKEKQLTKLIKSQKAEIEMATQYISDQDAMLEKHEVHSPGWDSTRKDIYDAEKDKMDLGMDHYHAVNNKFLISALINILKPIIGCCTCMASVWTLVWFPILYSGFDITILVVVFIVACINSVVMALYELISSNIKECNCK